MNSNSRTDGAFAEASDLLISGSSQRVQDRFGGQNAPSKGMSVVSMGVKTHPAA